MSDYTLKTQYRDKAGNMVPATLDLVIDWSALAPILARKAAGNKSGKTGVMSGLIKAKLRKPKGAS